MPPPVSSAVLRSLQKQSIIEQKKDKDQQNQPAATHPQPAPPSQPQTVSNKLLPSQFTQFQDRQYWDRFFQERKQEAFEWYGSYSDLRPFVTRAIPSTPTTTTTGTGTTNKNQQQLLVIGCGNSDFSTELYLKGGYHNVLNVDFSAPVIEEMRRKTEASCPDMSWQVMDVTALDLADGSYDVVLDKGTLDAIFSTPESAPQADKVLDEVARVLSPNHGRYLVVTLGQEFILRKLLERFGGSGDENGNWCFDLYAVEDPGVASPFLSLVGIASRGGGASSSSSSSSGPITLHFDASGRRLLDKDALHFGGGDHGQILSLVMLAQERAAVKHELREIKPGRFKGEVGIWLQKDNNDDNKQQDQDHQDKKHDSPRYTLSIVDLIPPTRTPLPCAVLIIPQGREHEWLFSTADGLRQVGQSADYKRLICVRMNRGHLFKDMEEVKAELGPVVMDFVPLDRDPAYLVPFLAVGESIGSRHQVVASGELPMCGKYCVEEEEDDDEGGGGGKKGAVLRRLVFFRNQHVIQSEIRLVPSSFSGSSSSSSSSSKKGHSKKGKKGKNSNSNNNNNNKATKQEGEDKSSALVIDWSYLSFDYHRAILAGLIGLTYPHLRTATRTHTTRRCLVIGLGGGGLPLFLKRYVPCMDVTVVELEGGLAPVAEEWFGFASQEGEVEGEEGKKKGVGGMRVEVGDGLARVLEGRETNKDERWNAIIVDVDNADASLGISCPAPDFLTPAFLEACRGRLTEDGGVLIMNVAARSSELLAGAMEAVEKVFVAGEVFEARPTEQDVNRVLFALKAPRVASACKMSLGVQTEKWLEESAAAAAGVGGGGGGKKIDPLGLGDMPITKRQG